MSTRKPKQPLVLTDEQQRFQVIIRWYDDFNRTQTVLQPKPTRVFQVGEQVGLGYLDNVIVQQVFEENMVYMVSYERTDREGTTRGYMMEWWFELKKLQDTSNVPPLMSQYRYYPATNSDLSSIFSHMDGGGLVCDPEYQREYVWTDENKDALLDSIFERLDIGAFLFVRHAGFNHEGDESLKEYRTLSGDLVSIPKCNDYTTAIIDGQQRLTTIFDFIMDRRAYRGVLFSQLNWKDKLEFMNNSVQFRTIEEEQVTKKDILRMFLQSNRGVPQAPEHMAKVQAMYDAL